MTRTFRAYNKRPILGGPGLKGWILSNRYDPYVSEIAYDYVYRRYGYWCMGNCPSCKRRDKRDQWRRTEQKKELRRVTSWEGWSESWDWFNEIKSSSLHVPEIWEDLVDDPLKDLVEVWYDYEDWRDQTGKYEPDYMDYFY
jgi:hypothetical protein